MTHSTSNPHTFLFCPSASFSFPFSSFIPHHYHNNKFSPLRPHQHFKSTLLKTFPRICPTTTTTITTACADVPTTSSTEDVFAIDAGRDLFFTAMDEAKAIEILDVPLGQLKDVEDRFIATERLKFFPSQATTDALIRFIQRFDTTETIFNEYALEERVARRKAVETLGRLKGAHKKQDVIQFLSTQCLNDVDPLLIETAVWSLGEIGYVNDQPSVLENVMNILDHPTMDKRVVVHTLLRANYKPALSRIEQLINTHSTDIRLSCACRAAMAIMTNDQSFMDDVVSVLQDSDLNNRRCAMEDITLAKYIPALQAIVKCPNSLVLRSRTVRLLLDAQREKNMLSSSSDESELVLGNDDEMIRLIDRLIWDHPGDLDLLGMKKETRKSRDIDRNVKQLYKNDAAYAYLASKTLAEDHLHENKEAGSKVLKSYNDLNYFDYFGAYHIYKTLGWLQYQDGFDLLLENAKSLPPRFFNHKLGAITALAQLGNTDALPIIEKVAEESKIWELTYACTMAAERLGDGGKLADKMGQCSDDWLIVERCRHGSRVDFSHLNTAFPVI